MVYETETKTITYKSYSTAYEIDKTTVTSTQTEVADTTITSTPTEIADTITRTPTTHIMSHQLLLLLKTLLLSQDQRSTELSLQMQSQSHPQLIYLLQPIK